MTISLILGGWYLGDMRSRQQLPVTRNPSKDDILRALNSIRHGIGVIGLEKADKPSSDHRPYEIVVYAEAGKYMPMLNQYDDDDEHVVRTLTNALVPKGLGLMMGESYPANSIVEDFDLVVQVFNEFANTGDVSKTLMS